MPNFRSGLERTLATQLKAAGVPFEYETTKLAYTISHEYIPDFILENGIIIEAKGYFRRPDEIAKMRAVKYSYPDLDIRFVFSNADKPIPRQKQTHGQWAERHGFLYATGRIPEDWLK